MTRWAPDPALVHAAEDSYEAIRTINHQLLGSSNPAPLVYELLGNLKHSAGHGLEQVLHQLASGLSNSLTAFNVYEDDEATDPAESVTRASDALIEAASLAARIGDLLGIAQSAIAGQGYHADT